MMTLGVRAFRVRILRRPFFFRFLSFSYFRGIVDLEC